MGQQCTNPLGYLIDEYGQDVGKFIVLEKSKEMIEEKYPNVRKQLEDKTGQFNQEVKRNVDKEAKSGMGKITSKIDTLKQSKKDKITAFEKVSGSNVDEMVGIKKVEEQFDGIKREGESAMVSASEEFMKEADVLVDGKKQEIDEAKPDLPIYENMPQCLKDKVWEDGKQKFGKQIEEEQNKAQKFLDDATDLEKFKGKINDNRPDEKIKHVTKEFEDKIKEVEESIDKAGSIGGMTNMAKGFF